MPNFFQLYVKHNDKFFHYDSFLQIADYKVFYLPYFSHYGVKAPRQKRFLTPTLEFNLDGNTGFITPYYIPVGESSEIIIKPTIRGRVINPGECSIPSPRAHRCYRRNF